MIDGKSKYTGILKSSGNKKAGEIYAKNLSRYKNLKELSPWIKDADINVGDEVEVYFETPTDIVIRKI